MLHLKWFLYSPHDDTNQFISDSFGSSAAYILITLISVTEIPRNWDLEITSKFYFSGLRIMVTSNPLVLSFPLYEPLTFYELLILLVGKSSLLHYG